MEKLGIQVCYALIELSLTLKILCGEQVWIITGDAPAVATKVACDLGILPYKSTSVQHVAIEMDSPVDEKALIITGAQLAALSTNQAAFDKAIDRCIIFAKVSPHQKLQIVEALRKSRGGRAVAFLGDGVNASLAILPAAAVGFS